MADDPQAAVPPAAGGAPDSDAQLIPVRYTGAQGLIVNGEGIAPGDIVYLPAEEVAQWPDPHPYYERALEASDDGRAAPGDADAAASPAPAPRKARAAATAASEEQVAVTASEPAAAQQA